MKLNRDDCERNLEKLINNLDQNWLQSKLDEIKEIENNPNPPPLNYEQKFNPLAFRISKAKEHLEICKKDKTRNIGEEILRVVSLGLDITELREKKISGLDKKIKLLMKDNLTTDQLEQIIYELSISSLFSAKGYKVEFLEESKIEGERTPDLLVDGTEIECTKKDAQTARDRKNEQKWQLISEKLCEIRDSNYCIFIETQEDPTEEIVRRILVRCENLISASQEGSFFDIGFKIELTKLFNHDEKISSNLLVNDVQSLKLNAIIKEVCNVLTKKIGNTELITQITNESDYHVFKWHTSKIQNGYEVFINPKAIGFRSQIFPDRIKSLENTLHKKRKQLSNSRPGVIFVELDPQLYQQIKNDSRRLHKIIESHFANNSRVSALVITVEDYPEDEEKTSYYKDALQITNPNSRFPLPEKFDRFLDS